MTMIKHAVLQWGCVLGVAAVLALPAQADDYGKHRYACHVITENGLQGYLSIRTDTLSEAKVMAARAKDVYTRNQTREPTAEVVECIKQPGRFSDPSFQNFVDILPR